MHEVKVFYGKCNENIIRTGNHMHLASGFLLQIPQHHVTEIAAANETIHIENEGVACKFLSRFYAIQQVVKAIFKVAFEVIVWYVTVILL